VLGSTGDAAAWNVCGLDNRLRAEHAAMPHAVVFEEGHLQTATIQPYVLADTAFRLSAHCMKCYDRPQGEAQNIYNAKVIRTRRCECELPLRHSSVGSSRVSTPACTSRVPPIYMHSMVFLVMSGSSTMLVKAPSCVGWWSARSGA
jgi:hypothetical protein